MSSVLVGRPSLLLTLLNGCLVQPVSRVSDEGETEEATAADCGAIGQKPAEAGVASDHALEQGLVVVAVQRTVGVGHPPPQAKRAARSAKRAIEQNNKGEISETYRASVFEIARYLIPSAGIEPLD